MADEANMRPASQLRAPSVNPPPPIQHFTVSFILLPPGSCPFCGLIQKKNNGHLCPLFTLPSLSYKSKQATTPCPTWLPFSILLLFVPATITPCLSPARHRCITHSHNEAADQAHISSPTTPPPHLTSSKQASLAQAVPAHRHCCPTSTPTSETHLSKWLGTSRSSTSSCRVPDP